MKFYHGTYNKSLIDIFKSGYLDGRHISEDTALINAEIERIIDEDLRECGLYLSTDYSYASSYDYVFEIDLTELNTKYLYVACGSIAQELYNVVTLGRSSARGTIDLVNNYADSFITFDEYISNKQEYEAKYKPEFIYFGAIRVKPNEKALNHIVNNEDFDDYDKEVFKMLF